jgi:hypothetical protein
MMDKKILKARAIVMLALLGVTSGCAAGTSNTASGSQAPRPTIGSSKPTAVPSVHEVAQTTTLAGTSVGPAMATCPPGAVALGGGWELPSPARGAPVRQLRNVAVSVSLEGPRVYKALLTGTTWAVYVNHSPLLVSAPLPVTAYVECLAGAPEAVVAQLSDTRDVMPERVEHLGAQCTAGQSAVGFGFDLSDSPADIEFMGDTPGIVLGIGAWGIAVEDHDTLVHQVTATTQCLGGAKAIAAYPSLSGPQVRNAQTADVQQTCPSGQVVAGGGISYQYSILGAGNVYRQHASANGWQGSLYASKGSSPLDDKVIAACLSFS